MLVTGLLLEGVELLVIGMGIVYAFLLLQVGVLTLAARLVRRIEGPTQAPAALAGGQDGPAVEAEALSAVAAAVHRYRADRAVGKPR
jgi:oxaloacetate decarboxylase (Na+ extruding) subunit gamma